MRCNIGASALLNAQRRNVRSFLVLPFNSVMRDDSIVACHQLCNRIAEGGMLAKREVLLNDGGLALLFGDDEITGMAHDRGITCNRDEQQINGLFYHHALIDVYIGPVFQKCGIESGESIPLGIQILAEVGLKRLRLSVDLFRQTTRFYTGGEIVDG